MLFKECNYILGDSGSVVIIVPGQLPKDEEIVLEVHLNGVVFRHGDDEIANLPLPRHDILKALVNLGRVGLVEYLEGQSSFPIYISAVANVEVMREAA